MATDILNAAAGVYFKRGSYSGYQQLVANNSINNDTIYITTDDGGIYLGGKRLGDYVIVDSISALPGAGTVSTQALYYATKENVLARSNGSAWVQINAAGVTSVDQSVDGDIVTSVSVDTEANGTVRTLRVARQKLSDNATFSDVATRLATAEGTLSALMGGTGSTSIATQIEDAVKPVREAAAAAQTTADGAVAKNTEQDGQINDLTGRMSTAETAISTTLPNAITEAKNAVLGTEGDLATANTVYGAKAAAAAAQTTANDAISQNTVQDGQITDLTTRMGAAEGTLTTLQGDDKTEGSIDYKIAAEVAKILNDNDAEDIDTLEEIAAWIKNDTAGVGTLVSRLDGHDGQIGDLQTRMGNAETAISTTLPNSIAQVKTDLTGDAETYTDLGKVEDALTNVISVANGAASQNTVQDGQITDLTGRVSAAETAISTTLPNAITAAKNEVLGAEGDAATANTVYGAKAAAAAALEAANNAIEVNNTQNGTLTDHGSRIENIELTITNHLVWGSF